jgi:hypothetical protein
LRFLAGIAEGLKDCQGCGQGGLSGFTGKQKHGFAVPALAGHRVPAQHIVDEVALERLKPERLSGKLANALLDKDFAEFLKDRTVG